MSDPTWNYVALAAAAVFEGISFFIALRAFRKQAVGRILSMYVGVDDVLVTVDLDFDDGTQAADAALAIAAVEREVTARFPMIRRLFIEAAVVPPQQRWWTPQAAPLPVAPATP
jgi:hypothetical protein